MGLGHFLLEIGKCPPNSHLNPAIDVIHGPRVIFSKKSHLAKIFKNARYVFSNCVKTVHVRNNSFTGLSTESFWYQNESSKSFGSQDRILPKYGHGRGRFGIFRQFLKFSKPSK